MSKLSAYDNQVFNDSAILAIVGTTASNLAVGGGLLGGIVFGLLAAVPSLFAAGMISTFVADPPTPLRAAIAWAIFVGVGAELIRSTTGSLTLAATLGAVGFTYATLRSIHTIRQAALAGPAPARALASARAPAPEPAGAPVPAAPVSVPKELPQELQALVDAAAADLGHLREALADPAFARPGVDAAGMRDEAQRLFQDICRRAPLAAHLRRLAEEPGADEAARAAAGEALAALRRQGDALRDATTTALQVAVSDARDVTGLRDHTENLQLLQEARADVDPR